VNFFYVDEEFRRKEYTEKVFCKLGGVCHPQGITETKTHQKSYYLNKREYNLQNCLGHEISGNSRSCLLEYKVHKVEFKVQSFETVPQFCPSIDLFWYFLVLDISVQAVDFTRLDLVKPEPF